MPASTLPAGFPSSAEAARYRLIVENVQDLLWIVEIKLPPEDKRPPAGQPLRSSSDFQFRFAYFSPSVQRMLGYTIEEALELNLESLLTHESARRAVQIMSHDLFVEDPAEWPELERPLEFDHRCKDGSIICCEVTSVVIRDERGIPTGVLGVSRDISARKRVEEALREEQRLLKQLLELHERDRQVLAYEIHDGLVQQMAGALIHLEAFAERRTNDPQGSQAEFDRSVSLLRESMQEARRLISGIRPPILDEYGISTAVEYLVNEARTQGLKVELVSDVKLTKLPGPLANAIFRIVQEALTNVRKHSGAKSARVEFLQRNGELQIKVSDPGKGFNLQSVPTDRFGLRGIRERTRLWGGSAQIRSQLGQGTAIDVKLPIAMPEEANALERPGN